MDMKPELSSPLVEAENPTLAEDLRLLAQDARTLAEAEIAFQKTRAAYAGAQARGIAILGAVAVVLAFFALMALVVGLVIALGPVLSPWGAMGAVTATLLLMAVTCALLAKGRFTRMVGVISDRKG